MRTKHTIPFSMIRPRRGRNINEPNNFVSVVGTRAIIERSVFRFSQNQYKTLVCMNIHSLGIDEYAYSLYEKPKVMMVLITAPNS